MIKLIASPELLAYWRARLSMWASAIEVVDWAGLAFAVWFVASILIEGLAFTKWAAVCALAVAWALAALLRVMKWRFSSVFRELEEGWLVGESTHVKRLRALLGGVLTEEDHRRDPSQTEKKLRVFLDAVELAVDRFVGGRGFVVSVDVPNPGKAFAEVHLGLRPKWQKSAT